MKNYSNSANPSDDVPVISAIPIGSGATESGQHAILRSGSAPAKPTVNSSDAAAISFLRQFRVLAGAARLYQRNHPRLMDILASAEQQLRIALAAQSPLVFAVQRHGLIIPRYETSTNELLHDTRGELHALAEELLHAGICSMLFTSQSNAGELNQLSRQISQVPRSAAPGDTASRQGWDTWLREQRIIGIRLNIPTERRDSLLLASLVSAVLAYDDAPGRSANATDSSAQPAVRFEQVVTTVQLLTKLAPPDDSETQTTAEDIARRIHSTLSAWDRFSVSLVVRGVSAVKPREGETLGPYLERLTDATVLAFVKQEYEANRLRPTELSPLLVRLDQERNMATSALNRSGNSQYDEMRVARFCEKFWASLPAQERFEVLLSEDAWCIPATVVAEFLEPLADLANDAEKKKAHSAKCEAQEVLQRYARCLESEEGKARRTVAAGLSELAPEIERLWPHPSICDFGQRIVQSLLAETSPGIAGLLAAVTENLARIALAKREYSEFERILEMLEIAPRDSEHSHISMLIQRILGDEQWLYLVDAGLESGPLNPVIPRLVKRNPDRLIDRFGLLLTAPNGLDLVPAMVRLIHGTGEPVLGSLELRLCEPRRQRNATAIHLLASADPQRLANALPRALPSWEWGLQDLAVSELAKWTNPDVVAASARAFLACLPEAHNLVVPCLIDHIGTAQEATAVPLLLQVASGDCLGLRDIYFRIKATEALGRMRVAEATPLLIRIVRERNGLTHSEPAALRAAAEEALELLENRPTSERVRKVEDGRSKSSPVHAKSRRYARVTLRSPLSAAIINTHPGPYAGPARVCILSLGGAFLESKRRLNVGDSLRVDIRVGIRRIESTAVVRNVAPNGTGIEFVHMKAEDRERLRKLVAQHLQ